MARLKKRPKKRLQLDSRADSLIGRMALLCVSAHSAPIAAITFLLEAMKKRRVARIQLWQYADEVEPFVRAR